VQCESLRSTHETQKFSKALGSGAACHCFFCISRCTGGSWLHHYTSFEHPNSGCIMQPKWKGAGRINCSPQPKCNTRAKRGAKANVKP
jgi:hypothetical protein